MQQEIFLIIGLGNPGEKYQGTRHNVGFLVLDNLKETLTAGSTFSTEKKLESEMLPVKFGESKLYLAKPTTFMNLSGNATRKIVDYYGISPKNILVIHDDLDLPLGKIRFSYQSGSAGHNGVGSIIDQLGTNAFYRLRIGVLNEILEKMKDRGEVADFVLQKFSTDEQKIIQDQIPNITEAVQLFLKEGFEKAASQYNK